MVTNRYKTLLNPPISRCRRVIDINRLTDKTIGKISKTNVKEVGLINGGMVSKVVCISIGNEKKVIKTYSEDLLKTSI